MKLLKHFSIFLVAMCCSFFANAQCSALFTYQVSGTNVEVRVTNPYSNSTYSWKLDGTRVSNIATADSVYNITGVYAGTHTICVYVYVPNGSQICDSSCQTITTTSCGTLTAQWTDNVRSNDSVVFYAYDTNSAAHHYWNFGDGSNYATTTSVTHVYNAPGTYRVCFYDYIPNSSCVDSICDNITVSSCPTLAASISGRTSAICYNTAPGTYTTTATGGSGTYTYQWYLGSTAVSGATSSTFAPGAFTASSSVHCTVTSGNCGSINTTTVAITVDGNLTATLSGGTSTLCYNTAPGTFTATGDGGAGTYTYQWYNGTSAISGATASTYAPGPLTSSSSFHCTITTGTCGSVNTSTYTVSVGGNITANWTYTLSNDTLMVTASDTNSSAHHIWNFGDNTTGSGTSVTHVYSGSGTYHVCFYCYIPGAPCTDSLCETVTIPSSNHCGTASYYSYVIGDSSLLLYSNSTGTDSTDYFVWYVYNSSGTLVQSQSGHTTRFQSHGLSAGTYKACLYLYNPNQLLCDSFCNYIAIISCSSLNAQWTYTNYSNVGGDSVRYTAPTNNPTNSTYLWTFGDGSSSTAPGVTHNYAQAGTYTVCLVVSNPAVTCKDTLCQSITVGAINTCGTLTAYWNSPTPTNDTLRATAYDTISTAHHVWNFGDGTSGSGTSVTHVYTAPGTYHVCFYAYLPNTSCVDSFCRNVVIPSGCGVPSFSEYIYGDTSIHAYSTSTGTSNTTTYGWSIKTTNGSVIQSQTGSSNYIVSSRLQAGTYVVCLTLYNGSVRCDSVCNYVVVPLVGACGTPGFRDSVTASLGGGIINAFTTSTSVDSIAQYSWKIWGPHGLVQAFTGVGSITSATLDTGTYTVCQYIRATGTHDICDSLCQTVSVGSTNPCGSLTAAWTHTLQSNTTDSVEFHSSANPSGTTYTWSFGDGHTSTDPNITHGYAQAGTYTVCLTVAIPGTNCVDSSCQSVVITTTTPCPVAAFAEYVYNDTIIHAYSNSTGTTANTVYVWSVTNSAGTVVQTSTSTGTTASFFSNALPNGTYNVCLHVYANANTLCSDVCHSITIADTVNRCAGLNANFTTTHLNNGNVQFIPTDTATGITHYWHFGDGTVSTNNDPVHAYATSGLYHVCQYVFYTGITSCVDSFCTNVQANASGCSANFTAQGYYPPVNGVHFTSTSTSSDSITSYRWTFGDTSTATFKDGNHVFSHSGTWYVCLYIATANGCSSSLCDSVNVSYDPCAGLSSAYTYTYGQNGGVHFVGSTNITNVTNLWTFGDGTTATTFDPIHYYNQPGTYTVCHIVKINGTLCADTTCQAVQGTNVGSSCHANFSDSAIANTNSIIFNNHSTSSDSIVSYVWNFGDGSSSTSSNTHHTYSASGTYYVCLSITSHSGCTSTYCDSVTVGHTTIACHASFTYTVDSCQAITFTSTSTGSLEFLRWIYGDGTTDTLSHPTHTYPEGGYYTVILHFYGNNCYNFDTAVIYVPSCASQGDTVCGVVFNDLNGNGVQNSNEPGIANAEVHVGNYVTHTDSTGHYVIVVPAGTYTIYYCTTTGYTFSIPVNTPYNSNTSCAAYQSVVVTSGSNCGYNFGILNNNATICGTVYFDANDNQAQDQNESGISNAKVVFTQGGQIVYTAYTDQYGHYCVVLPAGTYVITATSSLYPNGVVLPASITVTAVAGGSYQNNNFGVYVQPGACDLSINVTPNTTITPGYAAWYQIQVCNVGPVVTSGVVNLFYDPALKYNYASPAPASQNSSTFTATWNLNNLNPGSCQYYYVSFTADSTLVPGRAIFTLASVTTDGCTDANQNNNIDTVHQNVTASWDPNNKEVSPMGKGNDGAISGNQWLTYTINFQNTGTAPAVNIVVQDTLSSNLDLSTFKMLGASLPYTMQFAGNEVIWKFNSVMLPDSAVDQQGSHGFVTFMILPIQGLPGRTQITNTADIFFDYNAGVRTNQTLNTIDYTLSVAQIAADNVTITLQPNPFNQFTTIKIDGTDGPYQLNIYDMLGRAVKAQTATDNTFNVERGSLASGMYMYEVVQQGKVIGKGKMIAQ